MADTVSGATAQTIATSKYAERKGYRIAPSPGYVPGSGSPLRERPPPPAPLNPADGPAIVREMIQDTLEDLEDYEEWKLHCSGVTMWSFMVSLIGIFMILMSRAVTPLFYSMKPNDILFAFGIIFQLPLIRWMVILCMPRKEEKKRRKVIRVKKKERKKGDLHGTRFQIMVKVILEEVPFFSYLTHIYAVYSFLGGYVHESIDAPSYRAYDILQPV